MNEHDRLCYVVRECYGHNSHNFGGGEQCIRCNITCQCILIKQVRDNQRMEDIDLKLAEINMVEHFTKRLEQAYLEGAFDAKNAALKLMKNNDNNDQ